MKSLKKKSLSFILLFLFFCPEGKSEGPQLGEMNDSSASQNAAFKSSEIELGIFRIQNKIYFLSDLQELMKSFDDFNCLFPDSFLFTRLKLFPKEFLNLNKVNVENKETYRSLLEKLFNLVLVINYLQGQDSGKGIELEEMKKVIKERKTLCPKVNLDQQLNLVFLIKAENFFRIRFDESSFWLVESELNKSKGDYPQLSSKQLMSFLKEQKIVEAVNLFLKFLKRQLSYEWF